MNVEDRLKIGMERYGHGVRVDDDTTQFGTSKNSWMNMALEEFLDGTIYVIADYIRTHNILRNDADADDNRIILEILSEYQMKMVDGKHKHMIIGLQNMTDVCRQSLRDQQSALDTPDDSESQIPESDL